MVAGCRLYERAPPELDYLAAENVLQLLLPLKAQELRGVCGHRLGGGIQENCKEWISKDKCRVSGLAKKMMLVQSQGYREEYGFNSIFLLPVNLYGPGDNFDPASSLSFQPSSRSVSTLSRMVTMRSSYGVLDQLAGDSWHVDDVVEGILLAAEKYSKSEPVNLSSKL